MDTSATDHITSVLDKLTVRDKYRGGDQVHTASGSSIKINHTSHVTLCFSTSNLHLKNILHVPSTNKSLVSVNRIACDNGVSLEFHPDNFLVKEHSTRRTLLKG
jgi:hypothetical protein